MTTTMTSVNDYTLQQQNVLEQIMFNIEFCYKNEYNHEQIILNTEDVLSDFASDGIVYPNVYEFLLTPHAIDYLLDRSVMLEDEVVITSLGWGDFALVYRFDFKGTFWMPSTVDELKAIIRMMKANTRPIIAPNPKRNKPKRHSTEVVDASYFGNDPNFWEIEQLSDTSLDTTSPTLMNTLRILKVPAPHKYETEEFRFRPLHPEIGLWVCEYDKVAVHLNVYEEAPEVIAKRIFKHTEDAWFSKVEKALKA